MQCQLSGVEHAVLERLVKLCKDEDKAQLIASIARESVEESGEVVARSSWTEALEQALLDFEVSFSGKDLDEILDELEDDGILPANSDGSDTDFGESESVPANLVGKSVLALMTIFDSETKTDVREWESGVIKEVEQGDEYGLGAKIHVLFDKFSALQVVSFADVCFEDEDEGEAFQTGMCPFCERHMPLTFHHLIPRCTHKSMKKKLGLDVKALNHGVDLCRPCHSAVHRTEGNMSLAENYNTTEKLLAHPAIQKWIGYAKKQKCEGNGQDGLRLRK